MGGISHCAGSIDLMIIELARSYEASGTERREHSKRGCQGGDRFASTLSLVYERTNDMGASNQANGFLEAIVDFPNAGSLSWESRRFLRRCPEKMIGEFCETLAAISRHEGELYLDFDDYYFECDLMQNSGIERRSVEVLEYFKREVVSYSESPTHT